MAKLSRLSLFLLILLSVCVILLNFGSGKGTIEGLTVSKTSVTKVIIGLDTADSETLASEGGRLVSNSTDFETHTKDVINCSNVQWPLDEEHEKDSSWVICYTPYDPLVCFHDPLHCKHHFHAVELSAHKRHDAMPKYGEYTDLPIEKWILVLQHGGVVFLYHPCTNKSIVDDLRSIARSCLHRYIIAPSDHLNTTHPIAMVTWGCFYKAKNVNQSAFQSWIRDKAIQGPASYIPVNGKFVDGLVSCSQIVSDILDTHLCPIDKVKPDTKEEELPKHDIVVKQLLNIMDDYNQPENNRTMKEHQHGIYYEKEDISIKIEQTHKQGTLRSKFDKGNAAWALGSIVFLCVVLIIGYVFGKPQKARTEHWRNRGFKNSDQETMFDLLKSDIPQIKHENNSLFKSLRTQGQYRSLLRPIPEDNSDDDDQGV